MPPLKNTRHERLSKVLGFFVRYSEERDVRACGFPFPTSRRRFYVYLLCDPFSGEIFYVGKGKGKRAFSHERDVRAKCGGKPSGNAAKVARIAAIHERGGSVDARILVDDLSEQEAFELERAVMNELGPESLTNFCAGVVTDREHARLLLRRVKPFDQWKAEKPRTKEDEELYWMVKKGLEDLSTREPHPGHLGGGWYGSYKPKTNHPS
jgi:hypothetical protein